MNLFRTIILAVIIYYVWKIVSGMISGPKKPRQDSNQANVNGNSKNNNSEGEYTDYEELK